MTKKVFIIIITIYFLFIRDNYAQQFETIKIGLLISSNASFAAKNGALLAIERANKKEKVNGLHFQLIVRSMEGPWGTGSKEAVNLVFNEKVWAILGSHNGRNAHLVEQVIAKTHIVFLSAWASDPTLYQAFVPWFFSCVPNDLIQANILIKEIYHKRKLNKIAVVSDKRYDSKLALQSFLKEIKKNEIVQPIQLFYDNSDHDFKTLYTRINNDDIDCIVLFGQSSTSLTFIKKLRQNKMKQPVFGTVQLLAEDKIDDVNFLQYGDITIVSSGDWLMNTKSSFQKEYRKKHGKKPGAIATYAFDGINLIIEAIKRSEFDRERVQEAMTKSHYKGVTGSIQFDKNGNRLNSAELIFFNN